MDKQILQFFTDFQRGSNTFDPGAIVAQFGEMFMAADPDGRTQVVSRQAFADGILKRKAFFESIGFQRVTVHLLDSQPLDDHYTLAKTRSEMCFRTAAGEHVTISSHSTYILYVTAESTRIIFYTTHEDLATLLRAHGLLRAQPQA